MSTSPPELLPAGHCNGVIENLIKNVINLPRGASLDDLLVDSREIDTVLRGLFATQPDHDLLKDPYVGLINVFKTDTNLWKIIGRSNEVRNSKFILPLTDFLQRPYGSPAIVSSFQRFQTNWSLFTHDVLSGINWTNVVAAGGSVLACLMPTPPDFSAKLLNKHYQSMYGESDIDFFLWGLTATEAEQKMCEIYDAISGTVKWDVVCVRKSNVISIHSSYPLRPIQIILRLYTSPAEILTGFDVDAACCAYDGQNVWTNWRSLAACIRQANTIDITRRSPSYEIRLAKYASRGFEVYYPSLTREKIDYSIFDNLSPKSKNGLARLLILERNYVLLSLIGRRLRYPWWKQTLLRDSVRVGPGRRIRVNLESNDYDIHWTIPYGPTWDANRIHRSVQTMGNEWYRGTDNDSCCNTTNISREDPMNRGRRLHRHAIYAGSMLQCIGEFCPACPDPIDDVEKLLVELEATKYIRGRVCFFDFNAGRQIISGSFRPLDERTWEEEAYDLDDGTVHEAVPGSTVAGEDFLRLPVIPQPPTAPVPAPGLGTQETRSSNDE